MNNQYQQYQQPPDPRSQFSYSSAPNAQVPDPRVTYDHSGAPGTEARTRSPFSGPHGQAYTTDRYPPPTPRSSTYDRPSSTGPNTLGAGYIQTSARHRQNAHNQRQDRTMPGKQPPHRDTKSQPSAASGGIPNPTETYLQSAMAPIERLDQPRHLLVVIDLNGTILYRPNRRSPTKFTARPDALLFLKYCIETFNVVIWSSAKEANVRDMCKSILTPDMKEKIVAIWGRSHFNLSPEDEVKRTICYKRLTTLWNDEVVAGSHPEVGNGGVWDQTNTVLIDDSSEKAKAEPFNLIEVPDWAGDMSDRTLPVVHDFLNHLSMHTNVSAVLRQHPFTAHLKQTIQAIAGTVT